MAYLPISNATQLKVNLNLIIKTNNISATKVAEVLNVDTSTFKKLKSTGNGLEMTPKQYVALNNYLSDYNLKLNIGKMPDKYYDRLLYILYSNGMDIDEFSNISGLNKREVKSAFRTNGLLSKYKINFSKVLTKEEIEILRNYNDIIISSERSEATIRSINSSTLINYFMVKVGYSEKNLASKAGWKVDHVKSVLRGFITPGVISKAAEALGIPESSLDRDTLNSNDPKNDFGYFLQSQLLKKGYNAYSAAVKLDMDYCAMKGILRGTRNIRDDEFEKLASLLDLDEEELREKAPHVSEGDDSFVPYNLLKWINEHEEITYSQLSADMGMDVGNLVKNIRDGGEYMFPDKQTIMTLTGMSMDNLRKPLTNQEIESITSFKRKNGRKAVEPEFENFSLFVKNLLKQKGLTFKKVSEETNLAYGSLTDMVRTARFRKDFLKVFCDYMGITDGDIRKYNVETYGEPLRGSLKRATTDVVEEIVSKDESSILPSAIKEVTFNKDLANEQEPLVIDITDNNKKEEEDMVKPVLNATNNKINGAFKKYVSENLNAFLEMYDMLSTEQQITIFTMIYISKMGQFVPEEFLEDNKLTHYKRINFIIESVQ